MGKFTVSVLFSEEEEARFSAYCAEKGFKKSTLIARLVRDHLDGQGYAAQTTFLQQHNRLTARGRTHENTGDQDD